MKRLTIVLTCCLLTSSMQVARASSVATVAGDGSFGIAGADRAHVAFMEPYGVAVAADGTLYVSDPQAQNIRRILPTGASDVIAGPKSYPVGTRWVAGTFAAGPAAEARFNEPDGLAIAPDGSLIIADRDNHCLRRYHDGVVSAYAGQCKIQGTTDGPSAAALLTSPVGIAFDREGDLFVAEDRAEVRKISPDGNITTLHLPLSQDMRTTGISVGWSRESGASESLFIADLGGITRYGIQTGSVLRLNASIDAQHLSTIEGNNDLGFPYAIVALDDRTAVYTDTKTNSVRVLNDQASYVLAGAATFDPGQFSAGFADGNGASARFNVPTSIAVRPGSDDVYVVDSGNRRVRMIRGIDRRENVLASLSGLSMYPAANVNRTIAMVGNSFVWTDTTFPNSIEGRLQRELDPTGSAKLGVIPFSIPAGSIDTIAQVTNDSIGDLGFKTVVLQISSEMLTEYGKLTYPQVLDDPKHLSAFIKSITSLRGSLSQRGIRLVVAFAPLSFELSPSQAFQFQVASGLYFKYIGDESERLHARVVAAIAASGATAVDAWPAFRESLDLHPENALFDSADPHLNLNGRALLASVLATSIKRLGLDH